MINIGYWYDNGEFLCVCLGCNRVVRGKEQAYRSLQSGNRKFPALIHFKCVCGQKWWKNKETIIRATEGKFQNIYGGWIRCDQRGYMIEGSILEEIRRTGATRELVCCPI